MTRMEHSSLWLLLLISTSIALESVPLLQRFPNLAEIKSSASSATQQNAARQVFKRLLPKRYKEFVINVDTTLIDLSDHDSFQIEKSNATGKVEITGSTGVAAVWGLHYYLKTCNAHISWSGDQLNLPKNLPIPSEPIIFQAPDHFRYNENVCTFSYSSVWWTWKRWQREIDWMALQGINIPLVIDGQEEIWYRVYSKLGLTNEELDTFFTGPAFLAWGRMGNIDGWGGPLPSNFRHLQLNLVHKILLQMRNLGMTPVLSAFSGHLPGAVKRIFPNANITQLTNWGRFAKPYCCTNILDFNDPLFVQIGEMFIKEQTAELGTDHLYSCDTFNEMTPPTNDPKYLATSGQMVYEAMEKGDRNAIWLMQAWLFRSPFWQPPQVEALLTSVPIGRMLILDLEADVNPLYPNFNSFYGQPFIWCMLHNFGGTLGLYGAFESINNGPVLARQYPNTTMIGTGFTMEGIEQNAAMYELMSEMAVRKQPLNNPTHWFQNYAKRRYGISKLNVSTNIDKAWKYLARSVYNCTTGLRFHGKYGFTQRPKLHVKPLIWYNPADVRNAWDNFVNASLQMSASGIASDTFFHDLIDVTREALQLISSEILDQMSSAHDQKDLVKFLEAGTMLLDLLKDMDRVLASGKNFLFGTWLEAAKAMGQNDYERKLYEYNARNQITLWGPSGELVDYATKQWAGVVSDYYWPRWNLFLKEVASAMKAGVPFNQTRFNFLVFSTVEEPFTFDKSTHPTTPTGDTVKIVEEIHTKWRPKFKKLHNVHCAFKRFVKKNKLNMNKIR